MDQAIRGMHNSGVTTVVAAGNSDADACLYSPAREPLVNILNVCVNRKRADETISYKMGKKYDDGVTFNLGS